MPDELNEILNEGFGESAEGGFQLEFVSISRVIDHMTCYK